MSSTIGLYSRHEPPVSSMYSANNPSYNLPPPPVYSTQAPHTSTIYPISSMAPPPAAFSTVGSTDYSRMSTYPPVSMSGSLRSSPPHSPSNAQQQYIQAQRKLHAGSPNAGYFEQLAGTGLGFYNLLTEKLLYPCVVMRRQCQVNLGAHNHHITPFTLLPVAFKVQHNQGSSCLWKGVTSSILVQGMVYGIETVGADIFLFPREINRESSLTTVARHFMLKTFSCVATTPFAMSAFIESVQSSLASEQPGILDFVRNGWSRCALDVLGPRDASRRIPIWSLVAPTVAHSLSHYVLSSLTKQIMFDTVRRHIMRKHPHTRTAFDNFYPELFASFASHLIADGILYPLETVLHRLYLQGTRTIIDNLDTGLEVIPVNFRYSGVFGCFHKIIEDEGWWALYKGFGALALQYLLHFMMLRAARVVLETLEETVSDRNQGPSLPPSTASPPTHAIVSDRGDMTHVPSYPRLHDD